MALTAKQQIFADEYLIDMNGTRSYRAAYPSVKSDNVAAVNASKLLRNPNVAAYIAERQAILREKTEITQERVLKEYARLAFLDPRKLFDEEGRPKPITELDDDTAAALAGLDVQETYIGCGEERVFVGYVKKYKLADKKGALDSIAKHLGMFVDKVEHSGGVEIMTDADRALLEKVARRLNG